MTESNRGRPRRTELNERQRRVLDLLSIGATNPQIADSLGMSLDGAKYHVRELCEHFGVETREEVVEAWRRRNGFRSRLGILGTSRKRPLRWAAVGIASAGLMGVVVAALIWVSPQLQPATALYLTGGTPLEPQLTTAAGIERVGSYDELVERYDPGVTRLVLIDDELVSTFPAGFIDQVQHDGGVLLNVDVPRLWQQETPFGRTLRSARQLFGRDLSWWRPEGGRPFIWLGSEKTFRLVSSPAQGLCWRTADRARAGHILDDPSIRILLDAGVLFGIASLTIDDPNVTRPCP